MSLESVRRRAFRPLAVGLSVLAPALGLAGCGPSVSQAWNGPGWYLQKPYLTVLGGPEYFGGPYTYDKCEEERIKLPAETATQMLCVRENRKPERYGFY
ncbi:MAG: hypothetical protein AB7F22_33135 [Reyranella sp.]|uniref:hypothetical protein n=1 Tax=Reyranella sp. TaxID=1929291 RepID=UPI003D0C8D73